MEKIASFGSIFSFDYEDYVFLGYSPATGAIYAAKILDTETSSQLIAKRQRDDENNVHNPRNTLTYLFVVLTTDDFEGRAAHFAVTERNEITISTLHTELNQDDAALLLESILNAPVAPALKELLGATI